MKGNLNIILFFQANRRIEFRYKLINDVLATFNIEYSLSYKGCPYDDVLAEATHKIFKTKFACD
ncbi:hypothetical protein BCJMU51_4433 [Bacillus cereus]|nr:hypothetical protein BCM0045_4409 [Bacillus cereus]BCC02355.1 hypothetical protein BCM0057_4437 [Bacillus cereus]BCC25867.1 hypothetical protein BCM0079_4460 [Bacillus cereus]BCC37435.1 hypothetical protein BCM0105_4425 [Bacillus cereus]BCC43237.1 hypothetical protein BCJMU01_4404 [Bacillus cereus]